MTRSLKALAFGLPNMEGIVHGGAEDRDVLWATSRVSGQSQNVPVAQGLGIFLAVDPIPEATIARAKEKAEAEVLWFSLATLGKPLTSEVESST